MDRLEVSTLVYVDAEEVYNFLLDFPGYARYSEYLERVDQYGDGTPQTEYDLVVRWWKITYTAQSRVVDVESPNRIDWKITKDIDASGSWLVERVPEAVPDGEGTATRVRFVVEFDTDTVRQDRIDLPRFVSLDWVVDRVKPKLFSEAEQVVERIVADLEGERREVDLTVHETP